MTDRMAPATDADRCAFQLQVVEDLRRDRDQPLEKRSDETKSTRAADAGSRLQQNATMVELHLVLLHSAIRLPMRRRPPGHTACTDSARPVIVLDLQCGTA